MSKAAKRSLELYRKEAVKAAKDLCYPHKILGLLTIAESENEICRIIHSARCHSF